MVWYISDTIRDTILEFVNSHVYSPNVPHLLLGSLKAFRSIAGLNSNDLEFKMSK